MKKPSGTDRSGIPGRTFSGHENLRTKWRREFAHRRVDAQGMEPVRQRVKTLLKRQHAESEH